MNAPWPPESRITINGEELSTAESMTVRVALGEFHIFLSTAGLGTDPTGEIMTRGYLTAIGSILEKMRKQ